MTAVWRWVRALKCSLCFLILGLCIYVCMCYVYLLYIYTCLCCVCAWASVLKQGAESRGRHGGSLDAAWLCVIPWRQGISLNLELCWWPPSPSDPPVSAPHSAGVTNVAAKSSLPRWWFQNWCPHVCSANALTPWSISSTPFSDPFHF